MIGTTALRAPALRTAAFRGAGLRPALPRIAIAAAALLLMLTALLGLPSPVLADDTALGGIGGDYYPLTVTDIRMESETVQAICYRNFADYKVDFLFVNSGGPQTLMLGFPFAVEVEGDEAGPVAFRAWQDGKPLAIQLGQGPDQWQRYYLHEATFPSGKTMITVRYLARPTISSGERYPELTPSQFKLPGITGLDSSYNYWLHTGAGWAGTIGKAVVRFTLADDFRGFGIDIRDDDLAWEESGRITSPDTYVKLTESIYQWVFTDFEPSEYHDVNLAFSGLFVWEAAAPIPAVMGAVVTSATTSNPPVPSPDGSDPMWDLLDGSPATAVALEGQHPWIKLGIQGDRNVKEIRIVPGRNDTVDAFAENSRPKTVKVTLSDGTTSTITLADEPSVQKFPISGTAEWVQLDVIDSYPGSKSADVHVADVSFGNQAAPAFEPFDTLVAAEAVTTTSSIAPSGPASTEPTTSPTASPDTSVTPATSPASAATAGDPAAAQSRVIVFTTWPIVLFALAGAALAAAVALTVLFVRKRRSPA